MLFYRCQCFWGSPCAASVEDPCAKYKVPPSFPTKFSMFTDIQEKHCNETKCSDIMFRQQQVYQDEADPTKQKLRSDDNFPNYAEAVIFLQKNASEFTQVCSPSVCRMMSLLYLMFSKHIDSHVDSKVETNCVAKMYATNSCVPITKFRLNYTGLSCKASRWSC